MPSKLKEIHLIQIILETFQLRKLFLHSGSNLNPICRTNFKIAIFLLRNSFQHSQKILLSFLKDILFFESGELNKCQI